MKICLKIKKKKKSLNNLKFKLYYIFVTNIV